MPLSRRIASLAAAITLGATLAGCAGSGLSLTSSRTQGYDISEDALLQIRPGQSRELVTMVLGSPGVTNTFGDQTAWYYIETKVEQTSFGLTSIKERTVLAVYFDKNWKVADKAVYGLQDGRAVNMDSRRTQSFGADRTFVESILSSVGM